MTKKQAKDDQPQAITSEGRVPKYLVFDTETTGLPLRAPKGAPPIAADAEGQPRMASFAAIVTDEMGVEISRFKAYIKPENWTMAEFDARAIAEGKKPASAVNGLTDDFLNENGVPVAEVLEYYSGAINDGLIVVAFNAIFDTKIMRGELRRASMDDLFDKTANICVMKALDPYGASGLCIVRGFVKLADACAFFGIAQSDAHDAMSDAEDARKLLAILIKDGLLPEPSIKRANNYAA
jgi:DNA polymerase III epsilon subunit-like protein